MQQNILYAHKSLEVWMLAKKSLQQAFNIVSAF